MFSLSHVQDATRRALADGALQPIETRTILLDSEGVRFVLRTVSSLARKDKARHVAGPMVDPLGDYDRSLFVGDLAPSHYVLLNKFQLLAGHVLLVTRAFERQERLLTVEDFAALITCLGEVDGLAFYNGGAEAGASQRRKHLQLVPLPLAHESPDAVPMERLLGSSSPLPFTHAFARVAPQATAAEWHALYRELLDRCGISAVATEEGEVQSAPYNLLVRRGWMLAVPRSRECFESISVNGLGFAGSLFLRSQEELDRVRAMGPMEVLRAVAMPQDSRSEPSRTSIKPMKPSNATWIDSATLDEFRAGALASGYDEAIERVWAPNTVLETHTHPFDVQAVVVQGEMWLDDAGGSRHLTAGDHFALARETPHSERYGAEGATYWVARKST